MTTWTMMCPRPRASFRYIIMMKEKVWMLQGKVVKLTGVSTLEPERAELKKMHIISRKQNPLIFQVQTNTEVLWLQLLPFSTCRRSASLFVVL